MSQQRKLIALFRTFVEKVFLPHLKNTLNVIQDWHKFNSFLLTPTLNISELQTYVDSLPPILPLSPTHRKELPLHMRNQQNMHLRPGSLENSSRLTLTSVGEKAKNIVFAIRQHQDTEKSTPNIKEQLQTKELSPRMDDSGRIPPSSMPHIGSPKPQNYSTVGTGPALQKLLKKLMENQQKIDALQSTFTPNNVLQNKK